LDQALAGLPRQFDPRVLIGFETSDDAGVFQLTPECALVQTVDFFTPIVDDPYTFGQIAAANSLSDVYAMGGAPISALSILAWPRDGEMDDLREVLRGGAEKMIEAACSVIGGHSIADAEPKFGYAVTGTVHPAKVLANGGARAGDVLVFTKRLGTGIVSTALKKGLAREADVAASIASMTTLNKAACAAMLQCEVHACTDVTGFGLLGHAREMAAASDGITLVIESARLQLLPGVAEYVAAGAVPGGLKNNREFVECQVTGTAGDVLYDPQTSGGLLMAMPEVEAAKMERLYAGAYRMGRVVEKRDTLLEVE
jgi:selenide, water dikinase